MFVDLINQRKILLVKLIDLFVEAVPCCMKDVPLLQFYRFRLMMMQMVGCCVRNVVSCLLHVRLMMLRMIRKRLCGYKRQSRWKTTCQCSSSSIFQLPQQFLENISGMSFAAHEPLTRAFIDLFKPEFFELLAE